MEAVTCESTERVRGDPDPPTARSRHETLSGDICTVHPAPCRDGEQRGADSSGRRSQRLVLGSWLAKAAVKPTAKAHRERAALGVKGCFEDRQSPCLLRRNPHTLLMNTDSHSPVKSQYFRVNAYGRTDMSEDSSFSAAFHFACAWLKPETLFPAEFEEESDGEDTLSMDGIDLQVGRRRSDSDPVVDSEQGESSEGSTGGLEPRAGERREPDVPEAGVATWNSSQEAGSSDTPSDVVDDTTHAVETRQRLRNEVDPANPSSLVDSSDIAGTSSKSDAGCRWRVNDLKNSTLMADILDRSGNDRGSESNSLTSAAPSHGANSSGVSLGPQQKKKRKRQMPKFPRHTRLR
jgi:hypothetical protein